MIYRYLIKYKECKYTLNKRNIDKNDKYVFRYFWTVSHANLIHLPLISMRTIDTFSQFNQLRSNSTDYRVCYVDAREAFDASIAYCMNSRMASTINSIKKLNTFNLIVILMKMMVIHTLHFCI